MPEKTEPDLQAECQKAMDALDAAQRALKNLFIIFATIDVSDSVAIGEFYEKQGSLGSNFSDMCTKQLAFAVTKDEGI